jgi:hypothetical protein
MVLPSQQTQLDTTPCKYHILKKISDALVLIWHRSLRQYRRCNRFVSLNSPVSVTYPTPGALLHMIYAKKETPGGSRLARIVVTRLIYRWSLLVFGSNSIGFRRNFKTRRLNKMEWCVKLAEKLISSCVKLFRHLINTNFERNVLWWQWHRNFTLKTSRRAGTHRLCQTGQRYK